MNAAVADQTFAEAAQHYGAGRLLQADALCSDVLRSNPDHVQALNLAALIAFFTNRAAEGAALLQRVFNLGPGNSRPLMTLGDALAVQGEYAGAVDAFQRALLARPQDGGLYAKLGGVLCELKRFDEAEASYRHALDLAPD